MQYFQKIQNKMVIAIVIVYNPDILLLQENLEILEDQVDKVLIINNGTSPLKINCDNNLVVIENRKNLGIAKALNIGIDFGMENDYKYALLLDQDSTPKKDMVKYLVQGFSSGNIAMAVPNIKYINGFKEKQQDSEYDFVKFAITSGSLLDLSKLHLIGKFDENLFIDSVDFDYCFKIALKNYFIIRVNNSILYQRLGEMKEYKFIFFKFYPTNHNYIRRYYITRNRLYLWSRYFKINKIFVIRGICRSIYEVGLIVLFERDKVRKLKSVKNGICDFINGKVGAMNK